MSLLDGAWCAKLENALNFYDVLWYDSLVAKSNRWRGTSNLVNDGADPTQTRNLIYATMLASFYCYLLLEYFTMYCTRSILLYCTVL